MQLPKALKYAAIAGGVALFGLLFGWAIFPPILNSQLKKEMALSKTTDIRKMWEKVPFALDFKIYLFNYTNPEEVQKGAVPIVKEIGPYYFEEWKEKVDVTDNEEDDTISYKRLDIFHFRQDLSGTGLTGEEIIVMPHIFMLATGLSFYAAKPAMTSMINKALNGMFDDPQDIFMRVKALDILFRGIIINCDRTDFAPKATCANIKKENVKSLIYEPNDQFRFSIFGAKNNTVDSHVITVKRGIQNVMDVGKVVAVDGMPKLEVWQGSCNEYEGTDGTVFPPFLTKKDRLQTYSVDLCRSFKPWFQKKTFYEGVRTNRYIADMGDFANDPELNCLCEAPDKCSPKGVMDLTKCMKAPMYASMPHFLDAAPEISKTVKGLSPDANKHQIIIDFELTSGTPLLANQRIQFNMHLFKIEKLDLFKDLADTMAPLFWIDEGIALNKTFMKILKNQLLIPKSIVNVFRWVTLTCGLLTALACVIFNFKDDILRQAVKKDNSITKVNPEDGSNEQKAVSIIGQPEEPPKVF